MARLLEDAHWLYEKDVSSVLFPRSYNLSREPKIFLEDFRLTAAAGLLKWFVEKMQGCCSEQSCCNLCGHRPILMNRLEFAMKRCEEFVACENHQNIDEDIVTEFTEEEWNSFLDDYMAAVHEGAGIEANEKYQDQIPVRPLSSLSKILERVFFLIDSIDRVVFFLSLFIYLSIFFLEIRRDGQFDIGQDERGRPAVRVERDEEHVDSETERALLRERDQHISQLEGYISKDKKSAQGLFHRSEIYRYIYIYIYRGIPL